MVDWRQRMVAAGVIEKSCPPAVEAAARRVTAALAVEDEEGNGEADLSVDGEMAALLDSIAGGKAFVYSDGLRIAERNVQVADLFLLKAIRAGDEKRIGLLQKRLNEAGDAYRALMRDRARIPAEAGETLPKAEVRAAMLDLHGNITKRFRQGIKSAFPDLEIHSTSPEAWGLFADNLLDEVCRGLLSTGFAAGEISGPAGKISVEMQSFNANGQARTPLDVL